MAMISAIAWCACLLIAVQHTAPATAAHTREAVAGDSRQVLSPNAIRDTIGEPYSKADVDKSAVIIGRTGIPRYPESLRAAGIEGEAVVEFVVDTTGRAEPESFRVLRTTHVLFGAALRDALPKMRFTPAERGGRKVRQVVQHPWVFSVAK